MGKNSMPRDDDKADSPIKWLEYATADLTMASITLPRGARYEIYRDRASLLTFSQSRK